MNYLTHEHLHNLYAITVYGNVKFFTATKVLKSILC